MTNDITVLMYGMDNFDQHLDDLFEAYGIDLSLLPTADEVLSGVAQYQPESFFERQILGNALVDYLLAIWIRYKQKTNILVETKLQRFFDYTTNFEPELQIILIRRLLDAGFNISQYQTYQILSQQFGALFP